MRWVSYCSVIKYDHNLLFYISETDKKGSIPSGLYFFKGADDMEILGIFYGTVIAIGYGMFFYHNTGDRKHH